MSDQQPPAEQPGTPPGMDAEDVEMRSEIARFLEPSRYPVSRTDVIAIAAQHQAPPRVIARLQRLPDQEFATMQEIASALGIGTEEHRT